MRLNEIQEQFRDLLLGDYDNLDRLPSAFAGQVAAHDIPLSERLKIYRGNMVGNLTAALHATFPVIEKLVGVEFFDFMARHYILQNPPAHGYLGRYGHHFDTFISKFKPAQNLPYLYDTSRFEIALNTAYYAENDQSLNERDFSSLNPRSYLKFPNSASFITSDFPLTDIRNFCLAPGRCTSPEMAKGPVYLMIYRPMLDVEIIPLEQDEFTFLQNLNQNKTLGDSLEKTIQGFPDFDVAACLRRHRQLDNRAALDPRPATV
ncbi:MAG: HvfC/BufC family peptide modification chaperone [Alphaproteobacteria bacterium]